MLCPNCGNIPRPEIRSFLSAGTPPFRCRECGKMIRGSALVIVLDILSYGLAAAGVVWTFSLAVGETPKISPEEALIFSVIGAVSFRASILSLQVRFGRLRRFHWRD